MKAAKRKASRRGAKRVRTPEELEVQSTLAAIQEEHGAVRGSQHIERNGKLLFVNDGSRRTQHALR
jgi:hypothetical protein